ncbi:MAG: hypothetical protein ABIP38_15540 [Steroidobacteraceae bacterium]
MRIAAATLLLLSLPAWSATPGTACAALCGQWQMDTGRSDAVAPALDTALAEYKDPRPKRNKDRGDADPFAQIEAEAERSLGPIHDRLGRDELRAELQHVLAAPERLRLDARRNEILILGDKNPERRLTPGEPHARVDAIGTATIKVSWKSGQLLVTEKYDRRRAYSETYALQPSDGSLLVTREVRRPGMKALRLKSVYRRT